MPDETDIKKASLSTLKAMRENGQVSVDPAAPEGEDLPDDFWETAELKQPGTLTPDSKKD